MAYNPSMNPSQQYPHPQGHVNVQFQPQANMHYPPGVIATQPQIGGNPGAINWMAPPLVPDCTPGLEYLTQVDQLLVKQKVELLEALTGFETNNQYTIQNSLGQNVYWAKEDNDFFTRNTEGSMRPFDMRVFDAQGNEVIHMTRPMACQACCFPCCLQSLEVSSPPGHVIGTVEQEWSLFAPSYAIKNQNGEKVLRIEGPCCTSSCCCGDVDFKVVTLDGNEVGRISKQWSGLAKESYTKADNFGISFPMDLDAKIKAVLLGACLLIDYMFFEENVNQNRNQNQNQNNISINARVGNRF